MVIKNILICKTKFYSQTCEALRFKFVFHQTILTKQYKYK